MTQLTIVIPIYNDAESIEPLRRELAEALAGVDFTYDILFVNDGSQDATEETLEAAGVKYLSHPENRGYGAAIKTGVQAAESEYICIIDCDGTYPPEEIKRLMPHAAEAPMVVGARDVRINPPLHQVSKRVVCSLLTSLFGREVADINSGLRIVRTDVFREFLPGIGDRFSLTSSLTYGFLLRGLPIKYIPIEYRKRVGESKVRRASFTRNFFNCLLGVRRHCKAQGWLPSQRAPQGDLEAAEQAGLVEVPETRRRLDRWLPWLFLLLGLVAAFTFTRMQFFYEWVINGDSSQHTWWMAIFHGSGLYPDDPYVEYARYLATPGHEALFWLATFFMDRLLVGKTVAVVLFGIASMLVYLLARAHGNRALAIVAGLLFVLYVPSIDRFEGGLHRAFMFPLLLTFLVALSYRRAAWYSWIMGLQILFYPVAAAISLPTLIVTALLDRRSIAPLWRSRRALVVFLLGVVFMVGAGFTFKAHKAARKPDFLGPMVTRDEMLSDPVYYEGGRSPYLPIKPMGEQLRERMWRDSSYMRNIVILSLLFAGMMWVRGSLRFRAWAPLIALAVVSVVLFELAKLLLFKLYIPDRYLEYSFYILGTVLGAMGLWALVHLSHRRWWRIVATVALVVLAVDAFEHDSIRLFHRLNSRRYKPEKIPLYIYLSTVPVDALIAAPPYLSDNIATHAKRKALIRYELSHPWFADYREWTDERMKAYFHALYTDSVERLAKICRQYGVDYFVVDRDKLNIAWPPEDRLVFEPLNTKLLAELGDLSDRTFAVEKVPLKAISYSDPQYFVIDVNRLPGGQTDPPSAPATP